MISVFDMFSIGIGPSSSHTVGPMRAARRFLEDLQKKNLLEATHRIRVILYGSLALTGKGHATDSAIIMGLEGKIPETIDPDIIPCRIDKIKKTKKLYLFSNHFIPFDAEKDLAFIKEKRLPFHTNGMNFLAFDASGAELDSQIYYSIGGGFILTSEEAQRAAAPAEASLPYPFNTGAELLAWGQKEKAPIWKIVLENEKIFRSENQIRSRCLHIWHVMDEALKSGLKKKGELPGGLGVSRRASLYYDHLFKSEKQFAQDPALMMDWVSVFALAVSEENAVGARVVTAPTNGSAGVIPAILHYLEEFDFSFCDDKVVIFLLTAAAIANLYKKGASISGAEMGCQGEIGVACSMAAAGLAAYYDGTNEQIENAAEIGMEHNLGMTCDPVAGLVQIPCIERNAIGAVKAINAGRLALSGDGKHCVPLDAVIRAMKETGVNMLSIYKETSLGGLAVQVPIATPNC
jgi:L-serine dehydratase